jgi:hypothetical protein
MRPLKPAVAAVQGLLLLPAVLFMGALIVRSLPLHDELTRNAQGIVMWYAGRLRTLWMLLIALPLAVLVAGCITLLSERRTAPQLLAKISCRFATQIVAAETLMAGGVLAIVGLHVLAN